MHPVQRMGIALVIAFLSYFIIPKAGMSTLLLAMTLWVIFAFCFICIDWVVLITRPIPEIREKAVSDDGSVVYVSIMVIIACFASMITVLLLMISKEHHDHWLFVPVSIGAMLLSWVMVHTIFTFHYAHRYYDNGDGKKHDDTKPAEGLQFPGDENPDYIDFAYFSFVIGCTFQVSDVVITSRKIRRIVLLHGLLAFALNTFVVALTINFIGSLMS